MKNHIKAYPITNVGSLKKGDPSRNWMDLSQEKFAYGCLPLIIANELGWDIVCQTSFCAYWNGDAAKDAITIQYKDESSPFNSQVVSHFGHGILTFHPGFLFKTNLGHNLYVKGVPNQVKDSIQALEGVIETDWLPFTFTMNWKFTRSQSWVEFQAGESIARIMPYPRNYIESFQASILPLESDKNIEAEYYRWSSDRDRHNANLQNIKDAQRMEKDYFKGVEKDSRKIEYHQKKIVLNDFAREQ